MNENFWAAIVGICLAKITLEVFKKEKNWWGVFEHNLFVVYYALVLYFLLLRNYTHIPISP